MTSLIQVIINGILLGGLYALIAAGLSLSYGVMRIFNWCNGELMMTSLYISILTVLNHSIDPYLTPLITVPIFFIFGYLLCAGPFNKILERETAREPISILLFTAGISYIIKNVISFIYGTMAKSVVTDYTFEMYKFNGLFINKPRVTAFVIAIVVIALLELMMDKTEMGRALRCTTQDREAAQLMGMNVPRLYCIALGIGFACVGLAGSIMSPIYAVDPSTGGNFSLKCLIMVVLGGKGSIPGVLVGGLIVGLIESIMGFYSTGIYAQAAIFAVFVLVLIFKPSGLLSKDKG